MEAPATSFEPGESSIRIAFGGDVMFDPVLRTMWHLGLYRLNVGSGHEDRRLAARLKRRLANLLLSSDYYHPEVSGRFDEFSVEKPEHAETIQLNDLERRVRRVEVDWDAMTGDFGFPFRNIASFFNSVDLAVVNLETPLTAEARVAGLFRSHPGYARAMRAAGISIVNLANNHVFDAGEKGYRDTVRHLDDAGVQYFGGGANLEAARAGTCVRLRDVRVGFLGYTQGCNSHFASAASLYPGILPLDSRMMMEDVRALRSKVDVVVVSVHWGFEHRPNVHRRQTDIAHQLIDAGANAVIGHHPHVPQGIEIYRQCPILYSLGNLIFAQRHHPAWGDNIVAELVINRGRIRGVIVHPVAGHGATLFQPSLLTAPHARNVLRQVQLRSLPFQTRFAVHEDRAYVSAN